MKIGVLGGTFNPVHNAHLQMAALALDVLSLDKVLLMVAADPPHKAVDGHVDAETRLHLTQLGCAGIPHVEASRLELDRAGKSYTADTLAQLKSMMPGAELFLILGSDMLHDLPHWYRPERIAELATVVYVPRLGQEAGDEAAAALTEAAFGARVLALPPKARPLSSTMIRTRLQAGLPVDDMMPMETLLYCHETGLYAPAALRTLIARLSTAMRPKRFLHSAGCAVMAARLAEDWGADAVKARLAAYLHDCAKDLGARQLSVLSGDDTDVPAVQHAFAGAVLAKTLYGIQDDAVLRAIRRHCTGDAGMSALDKVIYLADVTEPTRMFPGVEEIRRSLTRGPDAAMLFALTRTEAHIREAENACGMHPATERAAAYFREIVKEEAD